MKNQTPVEYLKEKWYSDEKITDRTFEQALQMEAQKQQKYNEMLEMLERILQFNIEDAPHITEEIEQLIKEATEI